MASSSSFPHLCITRDQGIPLYMYKRLRAHIRRPLLAATRSSRPAIRSFLVMIPMALFCPSTTQRWRNPIARSMIWARVAVMSARTVGGARFMKGVRSMRNLRSAASVLHKLYIRRKHKNFQYYFQPRRKPRPRQLSLRQRPKAWFDPIQVQVAKRLERWEDMPSVRLVAIVETAHSIL